MKHVLYALLTLCFLAACSDGGGSSSRSSSSEVKPENEFNPEDFVLTQLSTLRGFGASQIKMELKNLVSDDAIYVTVSAASMENGKLKVSPSRTILNPTSGTSTFVFDVKDQGLLSNPEVSVNVTTAGNVQMIQSITLQMTE